MPLVTKHRTCHSSRWPILLLALILTDTIHAQNELPLSKKMTLAYNPNVETYFIAERLAVQHIGYMVFTHKDTLYPHQPLITAADATFGKYVESPTILRISTLIGSLRDMLHDNAPMIQYLLSRQNFPAKTGKYPFVDSAIFQPDKFPKALQLTGELADSLQSFYVQAKVADFISEHQHYYAGALQEVKKYLDPGIIPYMEAFYGERFKRYEIYIMPLMPITAGEDNYRAFGPTVHVPGGRISVMVMSSSKMLPVKSRLSDYTSYGYDNPEVVKFLTVHELGHSFVNPHMNELENELMRDTALFTPALRQSLRPYYIEDWKNCVIEHLVRLGEIRIALARKDTIEAVRLHNMHVKELKMVLIPMLEQKINEYEMHRDRYPDFKSFLPELLTVFHSMTPQQVR
jgi:hypothetical protein